MKAIAIQHQAIINSMQHIEVNPEASREARSAAGELKYYFRNTQATPHQIAAFLNDRRVLAIDMDDWAMAGLAYYVAARLGLEVK